MHIYTYLIIALLKNQKVFKPFCDEINSKKAYIN